MHVLSLELYTKGAMHEQLSLVELYLNGSTQLQVKAVGLYTRFRPVQLQLKSDEL